MQGVVLSFWQLVGLACSALLLGGWFARAAARIHARRAGRFHNLRGRRGERDAARLLQRLGYTVLERQARGTYAVEVDGDMHEVSLQVDYLVTRANLCMVAEVKTGRHAPRIEHAETRRQLLEYQLAFGVACVLLVDVEAGQLREVHFPIPPIREAARTGWLLWLLAASLGAMLAYGLIRH